jgi:hypothetical protein
MKNPGMITMILALIIIISGCESDSSGIEAFSDSGKGGSLARFTISGDYLYTVDNNALHTFNISNHQNPFFVSKKDVGFGIETIFPRGEHLFLGTQFGMHIMDISSPANPEEISFFEHIYSCDPVVVDDQYAYITLSVESWCGRNTNELQIVNITDLKDPFLVSSYPMKKPKGLGIDSTTLFICDEGLKVFDVSDVKHIKKMNHYDIDARDVIPYRGRLLVIGQEGIYQYAIQKSGLDLLSTIEVK